jgi:hypothetical protein
MEFTLYYKGQLRSGNAKGIRKLKHHLRMHFSGQLYQLWRHKEDRARQFYRAIPDVSKNAHTFKVGAFRFVPLVTKGGIAELEIIMLRPEAPGSVISSGGDIDNRIKTLLDGLCLPTAHQIPPRASPAETDEVHLCLLEDDRLVTRLSVETQELLEANVNAKEVVLLIKVRARDIREIEPRIGNLSFG